MPPLPRRASLVAPLIVLLAVGCGLEEDYTGLGERALRPPEQPTPVVCRCECGCSCQGGGGPADVGAEGEGESPLPELDGVTFRFTSLELTDPLDATSAGVLNAQIKIDVDGEALNVLLAVRADDREQRTLQVDVGAGTPSGDGYAFSEAPSPLGGALGGVRFTTQEPADEVRIPNALLTPPYMPLRRLTLAGELDDDAELISGGELRGALSVVDADGITLFGMNLRGVLEGAAGAPTEDLDGDGEPDAWGFVGSFAASRVALIEAGGEQ